MSTFSFLENKTFLMESTAKPYVVEKDKLNEVEILPDLTMSVLTSDHSILLKENQVKSSILPTLGISGLLKKIMVDGTDPELGNDVLRIITPILKNNIQYFLFFLDCDNRSCTSVVTTPLFDKHLEPISVPNDPNVLKNYICTYHLPVEQDTDYVVIDFDQAATDKHYKLNLARKEDRTKDFYPVIHNTASISWNERWDQRASIYDRERDIYLTLPKNYGKEDPKLVGKILSHTDMLMSRLNILEEYDKEFTEMLTAKLPKAGLEFMMGVDFADHRLVTILDKVSSVKEDTKPSVLRAIYKCLGYMVAKKVHCCPECRHLDEETL